MCISDATNEWLRRTYLHQILHFVWNLIYILRILKTERRIHDQ